MRVHMLMCLLLVAEFVSGQHDFQKDIEDDINKGYEIEDRSPKEAMYYFADIEKKYRDYKYTEVAIAKLNCVVAEFYSRHGLFDVALKILNDLEENAKVTCPKILLSTANVYYLLKENEKASRYYERFVSLPNSDSSEFAVGLLYYADLLVKNKKPTQALEILDKSIPFITDSLSKFGYLEGLGVCYTELKNFDLADSHLHHALRFLSSLSPDQLGVTYTDKVNNLRLIYFDLGKLYEKQNKLKDALTMYDSALIAANDVTSLSEKLELYRSIYMVCDRLKDYEKGFANSLKYTQLRDSIFSLERVQNLGSFELQTLLKQREKQEHDELNRQRLIQYSLVLFGIIGLIILAFYLKRFAINTKLIGSTLFAIILLFFEFVLVALDPLLSQLTNNVPILVLLGNFVIALLFIPLHRLAESWFDRKIARSSRRS